MSLMPALNDKQFLHMLMDMAQEQSRTDEAHELAAKLVTIRNLIRYIRALVYRPDTGDPNDGPRFGNGTLQRVRPFPIDPNCVERTLLFLVVAILLDPERMFSAATLGLDEGLHTFPVELTENSATPIILDSTAMQMRNLMSAALYRIRNASPLGRAQLVPWFMSVARNACRSQNMEDCYHTAHGALKRALLTGSRIQNRHELSCMMALAERDAQLFGPIGNLAYDQVRNSISDLTRALDTSKVTKVIGELLGTDEPSTGDIIKAALIAQFGPAAEWALFGSKLGLDGISGLGKSGKDKDKSKGKGKKKKLSKQERKRLMRRMTHAFKS